MHCSQEDSAPKNSRFMENDVKIEIPSDLNTRYRFRSCNVQPQILNREVRLKRFFMQ